MAIKSFATGSLESPSMNVYTLSNFNGVDYTSTPTLVDQSRGIDMSNYLPFNNSLVKRNGWSVVNTFKYNGETLHVYNIWKFKNYYNKDELSNTNYVIFAGQGEDASANLSLFVVNTLLEENEQYTIKKIFPKEGTASAELYSYGVLFENRLFVLAMNKYLMLYYVKDEENSTEEKVVYKIEIDEVKNQAFVPQVVVGLGHKDSQDIATKINDFNLLKNECYIELLNYPQTDAEQTLVYNIGQFFNNKVMSNIKILDIDGIAYEDDMIYNKDDETYVGKIKFDSESQTITITKDALGENSNTLQNVSYINLHISFDSENSKIIENMKFGIPYGSSGYRDRLFVSGNPEYPNLDIHSNETGIDSENWKDYTYFGDMSYRNFGTDAQKITGYGILNNGYMAIFKETSHSLEPNLYVRRSEITADSNGNYVESFPVTLSGISVGSDTIGQVINYGNDLLINAPKGIYKINTSESTATQTYEAIEMSYFIRDNLSDDITGSCSIIFQGKLYITRKDYKGDIRVYVADQDRYSYIDNVRVYEWWVLDGINATKFYIFNNELYFTDAEKGLCKFTQQYYDSFVHNIDDVEVNGTAISKDVSIDVNNDMITISPTSELISIITNTEDKEYGYTNFKNSSSIKLNKEIQVNIPYNFIEINNEKTETYDTVLKFRNSDFPEYESFLENVVINNYDILIFEENTKRIYNSTGLYTYSTENIGGEFQTFLKVYLQYVESVDVEETYEQYKISTILPSETSFEIYELYEQKNNYSLSDCFVNGGVWYRNYVDELGNKYIYEMDTQAYIYFNKLKLKLFNCPIDFDLEGTANVSNVSFSISQPVSCYWQSKYNSLDRLDYLKTIYSITFVPETKRGGVTNIGYRTAKSEVSYETSAEDQDFNFEYVDFNDFSFGGANMAKTYTSKKKIKNFSFIQLKFTSNDIKNSTIVALSLRYKYTRINKGVK